MQLFDLSFILLIISTLLSIFLVYYVLKKKPITQIQYFLSAMLLSVIIICVGLIFQKFFVVYYNAKPILFENFIYIGTCFLPVAFFLMVSSFVNTKIKYNDKYLLLLIVPIVSLLVLFTNDLHHLFYENYSFNFSEMVYGPYMYVHLLYTYGLFVISIIRMLKHTFKNVGFFSKQSLFIIIGASIPAVANTLAILNVIPANIYLTPNIYFSPVKKEISVIYISTF